MAIPGNDFMKYGRGTQWPAGATDWILAHPRATYEDGLAAGICCESHTQIAWYNKKSKVLRDGSAEPSRPMRVVDLDLIMGSQTVTEDVSDTLYEELFSLLEQVDDVREQLSPTQESSDFHAPDDGLPIGIAFTGDWHLGASGVETEQLARDLDVIRRTPGLYAVGMGDFVEGVNITTKAASALYSGLINDGNLQEMYALLRMGKATGKWLALVSGNHDEWMKRASGVSRIDRLAKELGTRGQRPPHFCQGGGTIFTHVGDQRYVVAVTHNAKGNSQLNTTNAQRRTFDSWPVWEGCDVICCGHLHYPDRQRAYRKGGYCEYLRSGTYKLRDGYAADNGFKSAYGVPLAILYPDRHLAKGWEGDLFEDGVRYLAAERDRYAAQAA